VENIMKEQYQGQELVAFRIGGQEFCIDIMAVREIRGWTPTTAIPHSPDFVRGIVNLRGVVLPVVDLAVRLGFASTEPSARHAIIVTQIGDNIVGLLVDAVSGVLSIDPSLVQPTPEVTSQAAQIFVKGVLALEGRMISILQLDTLLPSSVMQEAA
jgi:purine-binding chemotaxis protein CheW